MAETLEKRESRRYVAKDVVQRLLRHENAVLGLILIVVIIVMAVATRGATLSRGNVRNVLLHSAPRGVAAMGETFVMLAGGIDISIGGLALMTGILGASLMSGKAALSPVPILVVLLVGVGVGAINGGIPSRIGVPSLIITLAMWQVTTGIAYWMCRGVAISHLPESFGFIGGGEVMGLPVPVIIFIAAAVVSYLILNHTTFGRSVYSVGGNATSSWLSGINVKDTELAVFLISGFFAALAGLILVSRMQMASMLTAGGLELDTITGVVIGGISLRGGRGTIIGAVIGVIVLGIINNGMNVLAVDPAYQDVVKGVIIIAAVSVDYLRRS